ncbi:GerMN domain-containing protein [Heliorestis convoluta]|uniref:GerMN domain-containing protein n=1 Tax=Heliorestis convoluta TaxID=356322 RepID=A0A5Q2N967_9FIRM|nr:GerMN domain-containing protein [Heliorestis convoluta]QGG49045.1 GerMN domain-containing protein [Heliorestis convoluta]
MTRKKLFLGALFLVLSMIFFVGCTGNSTDNGSNQSQEPVQEQLSEEAIQVVLYFADQEAEYLNRVEREIEEQEDLIRALFEELKKPGEYGAVLPTDAELIDYTIEGKILSLNFNEGFANLGGSASEFLAINAIVNTFTELPDYDAVSFYVENEMLETGHNAYDQPVTRNENAIQFQ